MNNHVYIVFSPAGRKNDIHEEIKYHAAAGYNRFCISPRNIRSNTMASDPLPPHLHEYLDSLVPPRPPEMQAMEAYAKQTNFPIIGPASGYFCYQVARMIGARRVFELGSGYGYSTAWFAKAVQENLVLSGVE